MKFLGRPQAPLNFLAAFIWLGLALGSNACSADGSGLRLGGFGTLGYSGDNRPQLAAARDISQLPKDFFRTGANVLIDSRLGLQAEYSIDPSVDLVGQVVWRDSFKARLDSSTELAFVAIKPSAIVDIRVGRVSYDAFLMSDYRNVGYAYSWVRPPTEFYGWIPIFSVNGGDVAYNINTDEGTWRFKAQAGGSHLAIPVASGAAGGYELRTNDLRGLSASWNSQAWRLKAAYSQFTVATEVGALAPLHQGLEQVMAAGIPLVSAEAADLRRNLGFKDARITYATLGATYDDGTWMGQGELGHTTATSAVVPHGNMAYAIVGRHFGNLTAFLGLGTSRPGNPLRSAANSWGAANASLRDPAIVNINATRMEQDTVYLGARWDLGSRTALKLQWQGTRIRPSGYGLWWRDIAINEQTIHVNQLSTTLDFIF